MKKYLGRAVIIILLFIAGLVYWFYFNPYGDGERKGTLVKFTGKEMFSKLLKARYG